jgi:hypothetical protein
MLNRFDLCSTDQLIKWQAVGAPEEAVCPQSQRKMAIEANTAFYPK